MNRLITYIFNIKYIIKPKIITINPQKIKYNNFPKIKSDNLELNRHKFSELEEILINGIKDGELEDVRMIDKNGKFISNIEFIRSKNNVFLPPELLFDKKIQEKFIDSTYIHNHPLNAPLSSNDIFQMAANKIKKMVACTADGGYSIMERLKPLSEIDNEAFFEASQKLILEEVKYMKSLGKIRGITDNQRMELLNQWRYKRFEDIAKEFDLKFENKINPINTKIKENFFFVNPIERLIDRFILLFK